MAAAVFHYRVRFRIAGSHVHCRLFSKKRAASAWAKCGEFTTNSEEWVDFKAAFAAEFLPETD